MFQTVVARIPKGNGSRRTKAREESCERQESQWLDWLRCAINIGSSGLYTDSLYVNGMCVNASFGTWLWHPCWSAKKRSIFLATEKCFWCVSEETQQRVYTRVYSRYIVTIDPPKDTEKYIADDKAVRSNINLLTNSPRGQTTKTARGRRFVIRVPP